MSKRGRSWDTRLTLASGAETTEGTRVSFLYLGLKSWAKAAARRLSKHSPSRWVSPAVVCLQFTAVGCGIFVDNSENLKTGDGSSR